MSVSVITGYEVKSRNPLDAKLGPYSSLAEANSNIPEHYRFVGLKVVIVTNAVTNDDGDFISGDANTYWYSGGTADEDLVFYGGLPDGDLIVNGTVTATNFILTGSGSSEPGGGGGSSTWYFQTDTSTPTAVGNNDTVTFIAGTGITFERATDSLVTTINGSSLIENTDDLPEGTTNLYWTEARFTASFNSAFPTAFDTRLATKTTDNVSEGTNNLYFTTARAQGSISSVDPTYIGYDDSNGQISRGELARLDVPETFQSTVTADNFILTASTESTEGGGGGGGEWILRINSDVATQSIIGANDIVDFTEGLGINLSRTGNTIVVANEIDPQSVTDNTTDIATNLASIGTNASNISSNDTDIATNASGISANAGNISTNATDIGTNAADIATNLGLIQSNDGDIATNAAGIATNLGLIQSNDTDIAANLTAIQGNDTDIANNASAIQANTDLIGTIDLQTVTDVGSTTTHGITAANFILTSSSESEEGGGGSGVNWSLGINSDTATSIGNNDIVRFIAGTGITLGMVGLNVTITNDTDPQDVIDNTAAIAVNTAALGGASLDDAGTTTLDLWSASKIQTQINALSTGMVWKDPVPTYTDLATTYPTPAEGWVSFVEDEDKVYIYNGTAWVVALSLGSHNVLGGLDGGATDEYYHLSLAQYNALDTYALIADTLGNTGDQTLTDGIFSVHSSTENVSTRILFNGVQFSRGQSYINPTTNGDKNLILGGNSQGVQDWDTVKVYTDGTNDFQWNDSVVLTQANLGDRLDAENVAYTDVDNNFSTGQTFRSGGLILNNMAWSWKDSGNTDRRTLLVSAADNVYLGPVDAGWGGPTRVSSGGALISRVNGASDTFIDAYEITAAGNHDFKLGTVAIGGDTTIDADLRLYSDNKIYLTTNDLNYINYRESVTSSTSSKVISNVGTGGISLETASSSRYTIDASGNHDFLSGTATFGGAITGTTASFHQTDDVNGIYLYGYDDKSASYGRLRIDSAGNTRIEAIPTSGDDGYLMLDSPNYIALNAGTFTYTTSQIRIYDAGSLYFGTNADFRFKYSDTNNRLEIGPSSNTDNFTMLPTGEVTIDSTVTATNFILSGSENSEEGSGGGTLDPSSVIAGLGMTSSIVGSTVTLNIGVGAGLQANVDSVQILDSGVTATQLAVSGNGAAGQYLGSDGDGTFTWTDIPDPDLSLYALDNAVVHKTGSVAESINGAKTFTDNVNFGTINMSYGVNFQNGSIEYRMYSNTAQQSLYIRDLTNGETITTWDPTEFTVNKNLVVQGTSATVNGSPIITNANKSTYITQSYINGLEVDAGSLQGTSLNGLFRTSATSSYVSSSSADTFTSNSGVFYATGDNRPNNINGIVFSALVGGTNGGYGYQLGGRNGFLGVNFREDGVNSGWKEIVHSDNLSAKLDAENVAYTDVPNNFTEPNTYLGENVLTHNVQNTESGFVINRTQGVGGVGLKLNTGHNTNDTRYHIVADSNNQTEVFSVDHAGIVESKGGYAVSGTEVISSGRNFTGAVVRAQSYFQIDSGSQRIDYQSTAGNSYMRSYWGSNIFWDEANTRWDLTNASSFNRSGIFHENGSVAIMAHSADVSSDPYWTYDEYLQNRAFLFTSNRVFRITDSNTDPQVALDGVTGSATFGGPLTATTGDFSGLVDANKYQINGTDVISNQRAFTGTSATFSSNLQVNGSTTLGDSSADSVTTRGNTTLNSMGGVTKVRGLLANDGVVTALPGSTANYINNFNSYTALVLQRTGTGTGAFLRGNNSSGVTQFEVAGDGGAYFNGAVIIGTTSHTQKLSVGGDMATTSAIYSGSTGTNGKINFRRSTDGGTVASAGLASNTEYKFSHAGGSGFYTWTTNVSSVTAERMRLSNAGDLSLTAGTMTAVNFILSGSDNSNEGTGSGGSLDPASIIAGSGLSKTTSGDTVTLNIGEGDGIQINADSIQIVQGGVTATELSVNGNGSNGQFLVSDGDGSFSWFSKNWYTTTEANAQFYSSGENVSFGTGSFSETLTVAGATGISSDGWIHLHRYGSGTTVAVGNNGTNVSLLVPNGTTTLGGALTGTSATFSGALNASYLQLASRTVVRQFGTEGVAVGNNGGTLIGAGEWFGTANTNVTSSSETVNIAAEQGAAFYFSPHSDTNNAAWASRGLTTINGHGLNLNSLAVDPRMDVQGYFRHLNVGTQGQEANIMSFRGGTNDTIWHMTAQNSVIRWYTGTNPSTGTERMKLSGSNLYVTGSIYEGGTALSSKYAGIGTISQIYRYNTDPGTLVEAFVSGTNKEPTTVSSRYIGYDDGSAIYKLRAGYADTAGTAESVAWANVSGKPTYDATINTSGASVIDELTVVNGMVTKADTRSLTPSDIGAIQRRSSVSASTSGNNKTTYESIAVGESRFAYTNVSDAPSSAAYFITRIGVRDTYNGGTFLASRATTSTDLWYGNNYNGTQGSTISWYKIYNSGNANTTSIDWNARNMYLSGALYGTSTISVLNGGSAQKMNLGGLLVSSSYSDASKVPASGIWNKAKLLTGSYRGWGGDDSNAGARFTWALSNSASSNAQTWFKVCDIAIPTGTYKAISMKVDHVDTGSNYGSSAALITRHFMVAIHRSSNAQDNQLTCIIYGTSNEFIRVVKVSNGSWELQAKANYTNRKFVVHYEIEGGATSYITPTSSGVVGSSGTIYNTSYNAATYESFPGRIYNDQTISRSGVTVNGVTSPIVDIRALNEGEGQLRICDNEDDANQHLSLRYNSSSGFGYVYLNGSNQLQFNNGGGTTFSGTARFDGTVLVDTDSNTKPIYITRTGSKTQECMTIGITDTQAIFKYTEDTGETSAGAFQFITSKSGTDYPLLTMDETAGIDLLKDTTVSGTLSVLTQGGSSIAVKDINSAGNAANPYISFLDSAGTRVGYVGMGASSNSTLYLEGLSGVHSNDNFSVSGTISATSDVIAYSSSDPRLKDNMRPISNPLQKIQELGGYMFEWNDKQDLYKGTDIGLNADEVEKVVPEATTTRDNGYKAVKYEKMVPLLIEANKALQDKVERLEAMVEQLINK